ncbi:MAG: hypothetical protein JRN59_06025 [Nitrososphaerota archaeon]|jgi:hypothetical protein|nr:hypothetical protein [Nitrososphaerota archaeon]
MPSNNLWDFIGISDDPCYKWVLSEFAVLAALNLVSLVVGNSNLSVLKATHSQWWGSVTSIGLYDSWESTVVLPILPFLWLFLNSRIRSEERRNRSLFFMIGSIVAAILANYVWEISPSQYHFSFGVSGFDVAAGGIILSFSVLNLISALKPINVLDAPQPKPTDKHAMKWFLILIYLVLIALMIAVPVTLITAADPTINTQVHVDSLLFSVGSTMIFEGLIVMGRLRRIPNDAERVPSMSGVESEHVPGLWALVQIHT